MALARLAQSTLWLVSCMLLHPAAAEPPTAGNPGYALYFSAAQSTIASVQWDSYYMEEVTMEYWLYLTDKFQDEHAVFSYSVYDSTQKPIHSSGHEFAMTFPNNLFQVHVKRGAELYICDEDLCTAALDATSGWTHIAFTWSTSGEVKVFRNGEKVWTGNNAGIAQVSAVPYGQFSLGQSQGTFDGNYDETKALDGIIDEFRFWGVARSEADISANWNLALKPEWNPDMVALYKFDEPETETADVSPQDLLSWSNIDYVEDRTGNGFHLALGRLVLMTNVMTYATGKPSTLPRKPRYVVSRAPIMNATSRTAFKVNQNLYDIAVGLPSYWIYEGEPNVPDVYLLSEPKLGTLHQILADGSAGDQYFVGDKITPESTEWCPKTDATSGIPCGIGAVYRPTAGIISEVDTFSYYARIPGTEDLGDEGYISDDAFVDLYCEYVDEIRPGDREVTLNEDTIAPATIGVVATFGEQIPATITSLPDRGKLYEVQFKYGGDFWSNIETDTSIMQEIWYVPWTVGAAGTLDAGPVRGVVLYEPVEHEHGVNYTDFKFKWNFDGLDSGYEGTCYIHVTAVNDAPISLPEDGETVCHEFYYTDDEDEQYYAYPNGTCLLSSPAGSVLELKLNSTDKDSAFDPPVGSPVGAQRPYFTISTFPLLGELYQKNSSSGQLGELMTQTNRLISQGYVKTLVNGSSQRTTCTTFTLEDGVTPKCSQPWQCSDSICQSEKYHLKNMEGDKAELARAALEESTYFYTADNEEIEWMELEIYPGEELPVFLSRMTIYETSNTGSIIRILSTDDYQGPDTNWRELYSFPNQQLDDQYDSEMRAWEPDLCHVPYPATHVRLEVNTSNWPNEYETFDGMQTWGMVETPVGMVTYETFHPDGAIENYGELFYVPPSGYHAFGGEFDSIKYTASDCVAESFEVPIMITVTAPLEQHEYCAAACANCTDTTIANLTVEECIHHGWMEQAETLGYLDNTTLLHYITPDAYNFIEIPVDGIVDFFFEKLGLEKGTDDYCTAYRTMITEIAGSAGLENASFWHTIQPTGASEPEVDQSYSTPIATDGSDPGSQIQEIYASDCPLTTNRFVVAVKLDAVDLQLGPFEIDTWTSFQPSDTLASYYTARIHHEFIRMCVYDDDTYHYFDNATNDIVLVASESADGSFRISEYLDRSTQSCVPCTSISSEQIEQIGQNPNEQMHFENVCHVLYDKCPVGTYKDPELLALTGRTDDSCVECPEGHFQPEPTLDESCIPCPRGQYWPHTGGTVCLYCSELLTPAYADQEGMSNCVRCPQTCSREDEENGNCVEYGPQSTQLNTSSSNPGIHISDCVCRPGYYAPNGKVGEVCKSCPEGAFCEGGIQVPIPCGPGVWDDLSITTNSSDWEWQCEKSDGGYWGDINYPTKFWQCEPDSCYGGRNFSCAADRTERLCSVCDQDYMDMGKIVCVKCPGGRHSFWSYMLTIGGVMLTALLWYLVGIKISGQYDGIDIMLLYMQIVAQVQGFQLNWPSGSVFDTVHLIFQLVNFDVDFLAPSCIMDWNYLYAFYVQLAFPPIMSMLSFARYGWARFCYEYYPDDFSGPNSYDKVCGIKWKWGRRFLNNYLHPKADQAQLRKTLDTTIANFLKFTVMNYNILVEKTFQVFVCEKMEDGSYFLSAGPEVTCYWAAHIGLMVAAILGICIYVVGTPVLLYQNLTWGKKNHVLNHPRFRTTFGWMYERYELRWVSWEVMFLIRRFMIGLCLVFLEDSPYLQAALAIVVMVLLLAAQTFARPFREHHLNVFDAVACFSVVFYIVCGILFKSEPRLAGITEAFYNTNIISLNNVLFISILLTVSTGITISIDEVIDNKNGKFARDTITNRIMEAMEGVGLAYRIMGNTPEEVFAYVDTGKTGKISLEQFKERLRLVDETIEDAAMNQAFSLIDKDGSGSIEFEEFRQHLWRPEVVAKPKTIHIHRQAMTAMGNVVLAGRKFYEGTVRRVKELVVVPAHMRGKNSSMKLDEKLITRLRRKMKVNVKEQSGIQDLSGRLLKAFNGSRLRQFAESPNTDKSVIRFHQVDQWLTPVLADTSEVGKYAENPLVNFYRHLVLTFPFLLDWITTASEADRFAFTRIMDSLFECFQTVGLKGCYSKLIAAGDQASIALWLKDCSREQQLIFWEMMHAISFANIGNEETLHKVKALAPYAIQEGVVDKVLGTELDDVELKVKQDSSLKHTQMESDLEDEVLQEQKLLGDVDLDAAFKQRLQGLPQFQLQPSGPVAPSISPEPSPRTVTAMEQMQMQVAKSDGNVSIVGEARVGKLLVAAGSLPPGSTRCKFQWWRVREAQGGDAPAPERIQGVNTPQYLLTERDLGCQLRVATRPTMSDGTQGPISTAITDVVKP